MARLSLRKAAEQFDVSRPTLSKALKSGKISGEKDSGGQWLVDPAELARLYRRRVPLAGQGTEDLPVPHMGLPGKDDAGGAAELAALRERLAEAERRAAVAEALAEERAQRIEDLRRLLPGPGVQPARGASWWPWRRS